MLNLKVQGLVWHVEHRASITYSTRADVDEVSLHNYLSDHSYTAETQSVRIVSKIFSGRCLI